MCYLCPCAVFVPGMCSVCVEVWHILFVLNSLYSVFYVWYAHYYIRHYKDSILLLCTHIVGRFFAREYLYIG